MVYKLKYINERNEKLEFSMKSGIIIGSASGFTENTVDIAMSQGIGQIGAAVQGQAVQSKNIVITGEIIGETAAKRKKMLEVVSPLISGRLIYNDEWQMDVNPLITPVIEKHLINAKFQFTLRAAYPFWRKVNATHTHVAGLAPLFSFPWNMSVPFKFSERLTSLFANVYNGGGVAVPFIVYFRALSVLDAPKIIKVATREFIRIDREMQAGQTIKVDFTGGKTCVTLITGGIEEDIFGYLDIDSTLFMLDKGDNVLRYDADYNYEGLDVRIEHNDTIVGVY